MREPTDKKIFFWPFIALVTVLYVLSFRAYLPGFFNDDAFYIIGARSLLHGRFAELNAPGAPPMVSYMPGYPLLLAPVVFFFPSSFLPLQLVSIVLAVGSLVLFSRLLPETEPPRVAIPAIVLTALNPLMVSLSGTILSDIPFLFFSLLTFLLVKEHGESDSLPAWFCITVVAFYCYFLRAIGATVGLALVGYLLLSKRRRLALFCSTIFAALIAPYLIHNFRLRGYGFWLGVEFSDQYRTGSAFSTILASLRWQIPFYLRELFGRTFLRWPPFLDGPSFQALAILAGGAAAAVGLWPRKKTAPWEAAVLLYLGLYAGVLLMWHRQSGRYLLPVLPFVYFFIFRGWDRLQSRYFPRRPAAWAILALSLALFAAPTRRIVSSSLFHPVFTPPMQSYEWIRRETDPRAVFGAQLDAQLYLLTERQTRRLVTYADAADFQRWADDNKIDYVISSGNADLSLATRTGMTAHDVTRQNRLLDLIQGGSFRQVYENQAEGTVIYRAEPPPPSSRRPAA